MKKKSVQDALEKSIRGKIRVEREYRNFYSVDASSYGILPDIIIFPKDERDVISTVRIAKRYGMPVTARGAGTGLVGGALNRGIILDMSGFDSIRIAKTHATVGAGVIKGNLDSMLDAKKKFFAPNPSIGKFCSVGGMLGNNSSGSRSLKYGSVVDNIEEVTFVDGNGKKVTLPDDKRVARTVLGFSKRIDRERIPRVSKNSSGYMLEKVLSPKDSHKAIAGSEGTLGIILSAKLRIRDKPRKRALFVIEYDSIQDAAGNCATIAGTGPSAIEFVDRTTMGHIDHAFSKGSMCLLFVEYDDNVAYKGKRIRKVTTGRIAKIISRDSEITRWWKYRDSSLHYSLKSVSSGNKMLPHIIEDAAVPLKKLPELFAQIEKINKKFGTRSISYGHAGNGNIHVRLVSGKRNIPPVKKIADEYFGEVMRLEGTISAEHGDGLVRSEYVRKQYGTKNYKVFLEMKAFFDPKGIINPGKVISKGSTIAKNIRIP